MWLTWPTIFQAIRRLGVDVDFLDGHRRNINLHFVEGVSQEGRLTAALAQHLGTLIWPDVMTGMEAQVLASSERPIQQMSLFSHVWEQPLSAILGRLGDDWPIPPAWRSGGTRTSCAGAAGCVAPLLSETRP